MDINSFYRMEEGELTGVKYKPGSVFHYTIGIPNVSEDCALLIEHDRYNYSQANALAKLYDEKIGPPCIQIGVAPGRLVFENGESRNMRLDDYDLFNSEYGDFVVFELIPALTEKYGLKINPNPDWHMVGGGSSGGISSFVIAWFHPTYFHRIYMSSPSFLGMGHGNEVPYFIRKCETKPFKIYVEYAEDEPNDYLGFTHVGGLEARISLGFAGYDYSWKYFAGEGHCARRYDENEAYIRMKTIWEGYKENPIKVIRNSIRVDQVVPFGTTWEKADAFPKVSPTKEILSSDHNMKYFCDENSDELWKYPALSDGNIEANKKYYHGYLHSYLGVYPKGALDLALDANDHLYALTKVGIQCVRSFGLVDVILSLPEGENPEMIAIVNKELFLKTNIGIWKRPLVVEGRHEEKTVAHYTYYVDN